MWRGWRLLIKNIDISKKIVEKEKRIGGVRLGKKILNLNGSWNFKTDPESIGESKEWFIYGFEGKAVEIPAAWQSYNRELSEYTGYAWYSKEFGFDSSSNRIFIEFNAVDYIADVWLNGEYLGSHEGGFVPFKFEITNFLREDKNLMVVRVFDPENNEEIPHGKQGSWYTRVSGIWQDVNIVGYGESFVENVFIKTDIDLGQIDLDLFIDSVDSIDDPVLQVEIFAEGDVLVSSNEFTFEEEDYQISIPEVKLWEPENPYLYDIIVTLMDGEKFLDEYKSHFGMRKIETKDGKIYMNNKPLYIRGALDQAFWPETIYRAENEDMIIDEIRKAKDMGFNLLRKHIKTEDPRYLYWADKMGILIWAEPANYARWTPQAKQRFKKEYTDMVIRDFNHPSIIIWSIYNEEWGLEWKLKDNKEMQAWLSDFYDYARVLDDSRLVCDNSGWAHVKTDLNDYHRYFAVPENYREWNEDLDQYVISHPEENFVDGYSTTGEPLIISEFGIWGLPELDIKINTGERPSWFVGSARIFTEDFKIPATAQKNFYKYKLDKIFSDFNELARSTQEREYRGVKYLFEEMRKREEISGYVVTELTDIEWETNGFLKYNRDLKSFSDKVCNFNGAINIMIDVEERNLWSGNRFKANPYIVNNTGENISGSLYWELRDSNINGTIKVIVKPYSVAKIIDNIVFNIPKFNNSNSYDFDYCLIWDGEEITKNSEELTISSPDRAMSSGQGIITCGLSDKFKEELAVNEYTLNPLIDDGGNLKNETKSDQIDTEWVCLTSRLNKEVLEYIRLGGKAIFLAEKGSDILEKGLLNFKKLSDGESWDRAASFNFIDTNLFEGLPINKISGWEMADLYPSYIINNLDDMNYVRIIAGMFSGWIGNFSPTILELKHGKGHLIVSTLKLMEQYNIQPIGTLLLKKMIKYLASK